MLKQQIYVEFKKSITFNRILICLLIAFVPTIIQFNIISNGNYLFTDVIDYYQRVISGFLPMLFPVLMIFIYSDSLINEKKDNFLIYTRSRISLSTYLQSKFIINAFLSFIVAFLIAFFPFVLIVGGFLNDNNYIPNPDNTTTFSQFLKHGLFTYGLVYSSWVGMNGVIYASIPFLLILIFSNTFVALSLTFVWYHVLNFVVGILGYSKFSLISTIFPYNLVQQPLWTVLIPFLCLIFIIIIIIIFLKIRSKDEWLD